MRARDEVGDVSAPSRVKNRLDTLFEYRKCVLSAMTIRLPHDALERMESPPHESPGRMLFLPVWTQ